MENIKREKVVLEQIPTKIEYKNNKEITTYYTHKVRSQNVDELIIERSEDIEYANTVKEYFENTTKRDFSQKQIDFSYEAARLITGELKENKPVLVPVRCGFGKSTFIDTVVYTKIRKQIKLNNYLDEIGMVIVTERLKDLEKLEKYISDCFGVYTDYYDGINNQHKEVPWMYVMESWNKNFKCKRHITTYNESLEKCPECQFKKDCKLGRQQIDQMYSPIVGITTSRLYNYADSGRLSILKDWKGKDGYRYKRKLLLIDEKPKLTKVRDVSEKSIYDLMDAVSKIEENNNLSVRKDKSKLKNELNMVKSRLGELVNKYEKYRNAYVKLNEQILSDDFMELWEKHLGFTYKNKIDSIIDMFENGAVFCKTGKYDKFKTISMANFKVEEYKTIIFDGTAELSLEYDEDDFNLMEVKDYREYSNVTFHIVNKSYSKSKVRKNYEIIQPIVEWINKNINVQSFVVSYKDISGYLYDLLKTNSNIKTYKDSNNEECIPYFGNTKGMNIFNQCTKMIQIGWNRWDSDTYIAYRIATSKLIKEQFDENYEEKFDIVQTLLENVNGDFKFTDIEIYKLMQMTNDFEQEVFRTNIREYTSKNLVDIYIFSDNPFMLKMIEQRFPKCEILSEEWMEIKEYSMKTRRNSGDSIINNFYDWLLNWDGSRVSIEEVRNINSISKNYWKKIKKNELIKSIWENRQIETLKENGKYCIIASR